MAGGEHSWHGQVATLVNGMPIEVDPRDLVGSHILRSGVWEPETVSFLLHWLRPGMTVVDAGAHAGQYTLLARQPGRSSRAGRGLDE